MDQQISNTAVVLWGLVTAVLATGGNFFQKLNGMRGTGLILSWWVVAATACFFPTFLLGNYVYMRGGRFSVFVPVTAATYVFTLLLARFFFREPVAPAQIVGSLLILAGVALVARG